MKTIKQNFKFLLMIMAVLPLIVTCSGEDGTDGINGEDGNANVRSFKFNLTNFSTDEIEIQIPELTLDVLENDVILAYLKTNFNNTYYLIPNSSVFSIRTDTNDIVNFPVIGSYSENLFTIRFIFKDLTIYMPSLGELEELRIVILSTTNKSPNQSALEALKENDIDTNNYHQVMDYLELNH